MGLSGDESVFLRTLIDHGRNVFHDLKMSDDREARLKMAGKLEKGGYLSLNSEGGRERTWAIITEAGLEVIRDEKRISEAYSKGMEGGKKMFGNAVNRLRAKLSDQRIPGMVNKLYKHFSKLGELNDDDRALLAEAKNLLAEKVEPDTSLNEFVLNGKLQVVPTNVVSFSEIIEAAGFKSQSTTVMVVQKNPHEGEKAFTLTFGDTVFLKPGWTTRINAVNTGNA